MKAVHYKIYFIFTLFTIVLSRGAVVSAETEKSAKVLPPLKTEVKEVVPDGKKENQKSESPQGEASAKVDSDRSKKSVKTALKNSGKKRKKELAAYFSRSKNVLKRLPITGQKTISWELLKSKVDHQFKIIKYKQRTVDATYAWIKFAKEEPGQFRKLWSLGSYPKTGKEWGNFNSIKVDDGHLSPYGDSMWRHCRQRFIKENPTWKPVLKSAYHSPAYQLFLMAKEQGNIKEVLKNTPPPYYSNHQKKTPYMTVGIISKTLSDPGPDVWASFQKQCRTFGFVAVSSNPEKKNKAFRLRKFDKVYRRILLSERIQPEELGDFLKEMKNTDFYPSPDGLRVLMALSEQESSLQWNPKLNEKKKELLKEKFNAVLSKTNGSWTATLTQMIFPNNIKEQKRLFIRSLTQITDPHNEEVREYDFYRWSRKVHKFLQGMLDQHKHMTLFGQWMFDLKRVVNKVAFEPQTFGLWQVNVNHLLYRLEQHTEYRNEFPEIYYHDGDHWKVDRSRLVAALSGVEESKLDREKTLRLIIKTYLKPRYNAHIRGESNDHLYFIAENLTGEMATFKAALQEQLNIDLGGNLVLDGDLAIYKPYSLEVDWSIESNTQKLLGKYVDQNQANFQQPVNKNQLIKSICSARSWEELQRSELYRLIMKDQFGKRVFPDVKSDLYKQTPHSYARKVMKHAKSYYN